jgi:anti-sigma regulatory factor (Ser/Thr protein kinase)
MATDDCAFGKAPEKVSGCTTTGSRHTIFLSAEPTYLSTIYDFLEREIPGDFSGALSRIKTAVEELFMNIFHHAYEAEGHGKVMISCRRVDLDGEIFFRVRVRDWGRPYNPIVEAPRPDLGASVEARPIGGLGIHIVRKIAAHYCYSRMFGVNDLELFFAPAR